MTGQRVRYPRVSGFGQNPDRQRENLEMDRTFIDLASGKDMHRPQLEALLAFVVRVTRSWCTAWTGWPVTSTIAVW